MRVEAKTWTFLAGAVKERPGLKRTSFSTFCNKTDYDVFFLVDRETLQKVVHEKDVAGFSTRASITTPYSLFAVGLNTDNIQPILDKYLIEAIWHTGVSGAVNYEHNDKHVKEWGNT
jgi:hypothetical protein